jgi:hypothetical protein
MVKVGEVLPYAKKKCKHCWGKGVYTVVLKPANKIAGTPAERGARVCECAQDRFYAANSDKLEYNRDTGEHRWRQDALRSPNPYLENT